MQANFLWLILKNRFTNMARAKTSRRVSQSASFQRWNSDDATELQSVFTASTILTKKKEGGGMSRTKIMRRCATSKRSDLDRENTRSCGLRLSCRFSGCKLLENLTCFVKILIFSFYYLSNLSMRIRKIDHKIKLARDDILIIR